MQVFSYSNQLAQTYDQEIIFDSIEYMYQGFLVASERGEVPYHHPLSVYEVFRQLKKAFAF